MKKHNSILKKLIPIFFSLLIVSTIGCNDIYRAGNRITLDYSIDTKLNLKIIRRYLDTILTNDKYQVPSKWQHHNKLVDIDPENSKHIYFSDNPEEMYLIQFNGVLLLADVYNPQIVDGDYVAVPERMPKSEKERVIGRFKTEILDQIENIAKHDDCPDSVLYYKPRFINGNWTEASNGTQSTTP